MQRLLSLGLLGSALAHPAHVLRDARWKPSKRTVDLDPFRMPTVASYFNSSITTTSPAVKSLKVASGRGSHVDTATALVKSVAPNAEFRVSDSYVGTNGMGHVFFKQTLFGLDIDNADFNVNSAKDGSVFSYGNSFFTGTVPATSPLQKRTFVDSVAALKGADSVIQLGITADGASVVPTERIETYTIAGTSGCKADPEARLVYFAQADGSLALTWRLETDIGHAWLLTYVDAESTTQVHGVVNYVADIDASYLVYKWGINDPDEAVALDSPRQVVSNPWDLASSPWTWLNDGSETYDSTLGNNALSQANPEGQTCLTNNACYLDNYRPESSTHEFEYDYSPTARDPSSYYDASVTQLFYTVNKYHDLLYTLGFTEAAYNFQVTNSGEGGAGADWAITSAQDGSGTDNADFATPPDGQPGRMRMYLWTQAAVDRDCAFDAGVIIHEYTHGLSNRLTGGGSNAGCLSGLEDGGMGEGWGDFFATAIRLKTSDSRNTDYAMGAWVYNDAAGIRAYLYSTNMRTNPYTYASVNSLAEVHSVGTVWATILYEVLWNLIDTHGITASDKPTFNSAGVPTDGRYLAMKLVVDGMALQPCNPNFVSARDAIIDADKALTGGANACDLWTAFAKRGLGSGAAYGRTRDTESFVIPRGVC